MTKLCSGWELQVQTEMDMKFWSRHKLLNIQSVKSRDAQYWKLYRCLLSFPWPFLMMMLLFYCLHELFKLAFSYSRLILGWSVKTHWRHCISLRTVVWPFHQLCITGSFGCWHIKYTSSIVLVSQWDNMFLPGTIFRTKYCRPLWNPLMILELRKTICDYTWTY